MIDPGPVGPACPLTTLFGRTVCRLAETSSSPDIVIRGDYVLMIVLLIVLFVWWVENWKRDTFKEWWS